MFTEFERRLVYAKAFENELFGYGNSHVTHCWARFARDNDDICRSYFIRKSKNWEKFLELGKKYIPKGIFPEDAYKMEGIMLQMPPEPKVDMNDSGNWTEEERKRFNDELDKKLEDN